MPIDIALLKTPYDISLSGNPMPFSLAVFPYGAAERASDIRVQVTVWIELTTNIWQEVKSQTFYPGTDGMIKMDVQSYVDPYLKYYLPKPTLAQPIEAVEQHRRYKISYVLSRDNIIVVATQDSAVFTAIKGGMSYDEWHPSNFFTQHLFANKNFLSFSAPREKHALEELRFLFFLAPAAGTYSVRFTTVDGNGATQNFGLSQNIVASQYSIWCIPAGFNQLSVLTGANLEWCQRYTVAVLDSNNVILASKTYTTDYRNFYDTYQILYRNSAGGLDGIRLRGQVDMEADYNRQQAVQMVPPAYFQNNTLVAQQVDSAEEQPKYSGDTGFLSRAAADKLRDLFLAPEKWEYSKGKLLPISFVTKNTKFFSNRDSLISIIVAWQRAYTNLFYTPAGLLSQAAACPAVAVFKAKQISKNKLQVMYALISPYDRIEVQLTIGTDVYTFTYTGNVGSILQTFVNPATNASYPVTLKARTICDADSVPANYGPYTTINTNFVGNNMPVAVDDVFTVASGTGPYNLALSVLANDYDPDGDPIEALPLTTGTASNGLYSLGADGKIIYWPPLSTFTGRDWFDYQVRETGTNNLATARVFIDVGSTVTVVYAKIVQRNVVSTGQGVGGTTSAEVWMDFYSNAVGTQPVDITGLGLSLNIRKNQKSYYVNNGQTVVVTDTNTDSVVAGTGNRMKLYDGVIRIIGMAATTDITYSILPGQGYSAI